MPSHRMHLALKNCHLSLSGKQTSLAHFRISQDSNSDSIIETMPKLGRHFSSTKSGLGSGISKWGQKGARFFSFKIISWVTSFPKVFRVKTSVSRIFHQTLQHMFSQWTKASYNALKHITKPSIFNTPSITTTEV